ncbi:hypothetical protein HDV05_002029 [Chytridiales sp. JEL 0842]|nr:hypothetical protein HDV05_002029 [Chytridiales sp. JEL 0842]
MAILRAEEIINLSTEVTEVSESTEFKATTQYEDFFSPKAKEIIDKNSLSTPDTARVHPASDLDLSNPTSQEPKAITHWRSWFKPSTVRSWAVNGFNKRYGRTLMFHSPQVEKKFQSWIHGDLKIDCLFNLMTLLVMNTVQVFLDQTTYCRYSLENRSPGICKDAENGNFLYIARLGVIVGFLGFSLFGVCTRLGTNPRSLQYIYTLAMLVVTCTLIFIANRVNTVSTELGFITGPNGDLTKSVFKSYVVNTLLLAAIGSTLQLGYFKFLSTATFLAVCVFFLGSFGRDFRIFLCLIMLDVVAGEYLYICEKQRRRLFALEYVYMKRVGKKGLETI